MAGDRIGRTRPVQGYFFVNAIQRLVRADNTRRTRFHTSNGHLCLNPIEFLKAFASTMGRAVFHRYAPMPWLTFPAIDYLEPFVSGKRVFEFGSGMSTLWFARRCRHVVSVESDSGWYRIVSQQARDFGNVQLFHAISKEDYVGAISNCQGRFDLILVDGLYRIQCLDVVRSYLNLGGLLVVDNTDSCPGLAVRVEQLFRDSRIIPLRGWAPHHLHPHETTIIRDVPMDRSRALRSPRARIDP
ncbi:MAG: hypothetical protein ABSA78_06520 [Candidatus Sulfotelmatobacter sp.]